MSNNPFATNREGTKPAPRLSKPPQPLKPASPANVFQKHPPPAHASKAAAMEALATPFVLAPPKQAFSRPLPLSSSSSKHANPSTKVSKVPQASAKVPPPPTFSDEEEEPQGPPEEPSVDMLLEEEASNSLDEYQEEEGDQLSEAEEEQEEEEQPAPSNPKGRTPKVEVQFPCPQCMLAGKKCELHVSKKSMKCLRCFTKGLGPCRVVEEPLTKLPEASSSKRLAQPSTETFFKVGPKLKQPVQASTDTEIQVVIPGPNKHKRSKVASREDSESELEILPAPQSRQQASSKVQDDLWEAFDRLHTVHSFISDPQLRKTLLFLDAELEKAIHLVKPSTSKLN